MQRSDWRRPRARLQLDGVFDTTLRREARWELIGEDVLELDEQLDDVGIVRPPGRGLRCGSGVGWLRPNDDGEDLFDLLASNRFA